ncbi:MAG: UDP-N-acetylglucosamine 2-epimerase (non-hydrolyzing) [Bacteriovoracaceae bacterium]
MNSGLIKILTVIGARPQFIKAAAVSRAVAVFAEKKNRMVEEVICHTGQHYDRDMSKIFFEELNIPEPKYHLAVGSGSHAVQTGKMLEAIEGVINLEKPSCVLVYGDTNSTLAAALVVSKMGIPLVHVEAGLRSFNRSMPEEINRVLTDHLAALNFCPTKVAVDNLAREGITKGVFQVGDVMFDMVKMSQEIAQSRSKMREKLGLEKKQFILATVHRPVNTDDPDALKRIVTSFSKLEKKILFPLHPRVREKIRSFKLEKFIGENTILEAPLSYFDMIAMLSDASMLITDSGGAQKEARILKVPCVTLREETEWTETLEDGWNQLVGSDFEKIITAVKNTNIDFKKGRSLEDLYGDGFAAFKIVEFILDKL